MGILFPSLAQAIILLRRQADFYGKKFPFGRYRRKYRQLAKINFSNFFDYGKNTLPLASNFLYSIAARRKWLAGGKTHYLQPNR